jgi:GNAT superfamily N-acetyltransferase
MNDEVVVRLANVDDADVIAYHRASMFHHMGQLSDALFEPFRIRSAERLREMFLTAEYFGWLAAPATTLDEIIAGAGVQLRTVLPHPAGSGAFAEGRHGLIINVFTEPDWRRQGIAELLLKEIIQWSRVRKLDRLVLHASAEGRALYERFGFIPTNEMRLQSQQ